MIVELLWKEEDYISFMIDDKYTVDIPHHYMYEDEVEEYPTGIDRSGNIKVDYRRVTIEEQINKIYSIKEIEEHAKKLLIEVKKEWEKISDDIYRKGDRYIKFIEI